MRISIQLSPKSGIEMIPETVADKVETQDRYGDGYSGVYDQPPGRREHTLVRQQGSE